jgi:hypothetical protein
MLLVEYEIRYYWRNVGGKYEIRISVDAVVEI